MIGCDVLVRAVAHWTPLGVPNACSRTYLVQYALVAEKNDAEPRFVPRPAARTVAMLKG